MTQTEDEGYLIAGYRGFVGPWIFRLNSDGSVVWQRQYGGSDGTVVESIDKTADGGAIVAGVTSDLDDDAFAMKLNNDGTIAWQRTYDGGDEDFFRSILETEDGSFVAAGSRGGDGWILKLHNDGLIDWQYSYEYTFNSEFKSLSRTGTSSFVVAGSGYGASGSTGDLLRVDANGTVEWVRSYLGGQFASVIEADSGGYAAAGLMIDDIGNRDAFTIRVNDMGFVSDCDILETAGGGTVVNNVTVGVINRPSIASSFESHFSQPDVLSSNLETTTVCPAPSEVHSSEMAVEPGC